MTSPDARHPYLDADVRLRRLIFAGAFATGVDAARLRHELSAGLVDRHDVAALQRLLTHVERTAHTYALLSDVARERLGIPRLTRRAAVAQGVVDAAS